MKIAIMQPYFFPYIGYFQLINAVDLFVVLDDVNFIKRGWINRNRIIVNNEIFTFTLPLANASQNELICNTHLTMVPWKDKLLRTIEFSYKKAPYFLTAFPLVKTIIDNPENNISKYIYISLVEINNYLQIKTPIVESSLIYSNTDLKAQDKILDICIKEKADNYLNPIGGKDLYSEKTFLNNNIKLEFLKSGDIRYKQFGNEFFPMLSIIDTIMFNHPTEIRELLAKYNLVQYGSC